MQKRHFTKKDMFDIILFGDLRDVDIDDIVKKGVEQI